MGVIGHNARTWQTYHETVTLTAIELAETRIAMVCLGILSANNSVLLAAFDLPYPFADHKLVRAPKTHCGPTKLCALQLWVLVLSISFILCLVVLKLDVFHTAWVKRIAVMKEVKTGICLC